MTRHDTMTSDEKRRAERALLWKIDLMLMPILTFSFGLQYMDKAVLNSASIFGIIKDLGLSTTTNGVTSTLRYSTANAAFYYGYIISVLPIALILQRLPIVKTLAAFIFVWGVVCLLTVVVKDYKGLVVQRVFLGLTEAAVSPGFVALTSLWYKKDEQAIRLGIWYGATGLFSMFSGVVFYGIGHAGGSLPVWKYMYIFAGSLTILWSFIVLLVLPDSPTNPGRFFRSPEERRLLLERLESNMTGKDQTGFKWGQAREAVADVKIWLFLCMGAASYICNGGVTAFGARIVSSFGYTSLQTILLLIPGGAMTVISLWIFGWLAGRKENIRTYLIPISCIPVMVGAIIIWKGSWVHRGLPLFGYYLLPTFGTPYVLTLALSSANVAGGTKKAISTGAIFIGYNVGNIAGSYLVFTPEKAIHYRSTWISIIVCMVFVSCASLVLRYMLDRENKRRDALYGPVILDKEGSGPSPSPVTLDLKGGPAGDAAPVVEKAQVDEASSIAFADLTDKEQTSFRYSL